MTGTRGFPGRRVTPLLSGRVAYDPGPLEPPEEGEALVCCAGPVVLG